MERMILDSDLKLPKPWNGFGVRDLGVRAWGGMGARERERAGVVRIELSCESERDRE